MTTEKKRRYVHVGTNKVACWIYPAYDLGEPSDEWGRTWVCECDGDAPSNAFLADWARTSGRGASEGAAVASYVAAADRNGREG